MTRTRRCLGGAVVGAVTASLLALALPTHGEDRPAGANARIVGKVTWRGEPAPGTVVFAYRSLAESASYRPAAASPPAGADGAYLLELPAGTYHLVAKRGSGKGDGPLPSGGLHCFHGSNPFTVAAGTKTEASFSLATKAADPRVEPGPDPGSGVLSGVVTWRNTPLPGVSVKLYLDGESDFRGSGYAVAPPTDERGEFRFDYLPDSAYYVVARRRTAGPGAGPVAEGDHYGFFVDNPVPVHNGTAVRIELEMLQKGKPAGNADSRPRPSGTSISGRITGPDGAPVANVHAFAYANRLMSHEKPDFLSAEAGADGRYVIHLSRGGTFYVGVRSGYGDSPGKGEWHGLYDGSADHGVTVPDGGIVEGIDIRVERILP